MKLLGKSAGNLIASTIVGTLVVASFTQPDQATHERHVASAIADLASESLEEGRLFKWLVVKTASQVRTGEFERGIFSSTSRVLIAGHEVARCTGALGVVFCKRVGS